MKRKKTKIFIFILLAIAIVLAGTSSYLIITIKNDVNNLENKITNYKENIVKTDIDTYVNNDFRVSSKKIVNTVNKGIIQNKSVKKILMALGAIYAIERKKMKSLYVTIDTKLNTAKARKKIKSRIYDSTFLNFNRYIKTKWFAR